MKEHKKSFKLNGNGTTNKYFIAAQNKSHEKAEKKLTESRNRF